MAPGGTLEGMSEPSHEISQRDLRNRSAEIMDGLERGERYTVTRNGHRIGELVPIRRERRAVSRADFAAVSARDAPPR